MKQIIFFIMLFSIIRLAASQENPESICYPKDLNGRVREHNVDFEKMVLEVSFLPEDRLVIGNVRYDFKPIRKQVDTLFFDAVDITVKSARLDGQDIPFVSTNLGITVKFNPPLVWGSNHKIEFNYEATPRKGIYFVGWNDPKNIMRKQIWTQGQGTDNRHWIPSYDSQNDKLITETIINFSRQYEVISNGKLTSVEDRHDGDLTWHYQMSKPHASYLVMIAIGQYDYKEMEGTNGVKIRQYYYPDHPDAFEPMYQYSEEMMNWCEQEFGVPYPWETYANVPVAEYIYGAMENTTATVFTDYYVQNERAALEKNYLGTNAHELVHQWFGDYITAWSSHDHWLHESFATHYAKHFQQHVKGEEAYQWLKKTEIQSAISAGKKNQIPVVNSGAGSARHYQKGSLVLDMLKYVVGKEQFDEVIKYYLTKYQYSNVETRNLQMSFMEKLGINLDWFFDEWLYRGGEPNFDIEHQILKDKTIFVVKQTQEIGDLVGYFKMPVFFDVYYEGGSKSSEKYWVYGPVDTIIVSNPFLKKVEFVLFDPKNEILKTVDYKNKDENEWTAQALNAENMIDRYEGLFALRETDIKKKRNELIRIYNNEAFYAIKSEVVRQMSNDTNPKTLALLKAALNDEHPYVRRSVVESMQVIDKELIPEVEQMLSDPSYINIEKALRKLCEELPENKEKYLALTANEAGIDHNIRIAWLELKCMDEMTKFLPELIDYSGASYGFRTRILAMNALKNINYCDSIVLGNIVDGILSTNRRLAGPSKRILTSFKEHQNHLGLIKSYYKTRDWKEWELGIIHDMFEIDSTSAD